MFSCQVGAGKVRDYWPYPRILWISSDKIRDVVFVILALGDLGQCGFFVGVAWHHLMPSKSSISPLLGTPLICTS